MLICLQASSAAFEKSDVILIPDTVSLFIFLFGGFKILLSPVFWNLILRCLDKGLFIFILCVVSFKIWEIFLLDFHGFLLSFFPSCSTWNFPRLFPPLCLFILCSWRLLQVYLPTISLNFNLPNITFFICEKIFKIFYILYVFIYYVVSQHRVHH